MIFSDENVLNQNNIKIYLFGEVLFDVFPDNTVLGGAPFNVAYNLKRFGLNPDFISRIGDDEMGAEILRLMSRWGMQSRFVQIDSERPTGQVSVNIIDGQPEYTIEQNQAYDFISPVDLKESKEDRGIIYHGSLALRNENNNKTLSELVTATGFPVFVDLNLRTPWWDNELIENVLHRSKWAKMSDEELETVYSIHEIKEPFSEKIMNYVADRYGLDMLFVTSGESGSCCVAGGKLYHEKAHKVNEIEDTVGAGDAYSSVCIYGISKGWDINLIMEKASEFAAAVCSNKGALIQNNQIFNKTVNK